MNTPPSSPEDQPRPEHTTADLRELAAEIVLDPEQTHVLVTGAFEGIPLADDQELEVGRRSPGKRVFSNEGNKVFTPSEGDLTLLEPTELKEGQPKHGVLYSAVGSVLSIERRAQRGTPTQKQTQGHREARDPLVRGVMEVALTPEDQMEQKLPAVLELATAIQEFTGTDAEQAQRFTSHLLNAAHTLVFGAVILKRPRGKS